MPARTLLAVSLLLSAAAALLFTGPAVAAEAKDLVELREGAATAARPFGHHPDTPLGRFRYYVEQGRIEDAPAAFEELVGFEQRHEALRSAVYPVTYPAGTRGLVLRCAEITLRSEGDPHKRASVYRILAQMNHRLKDTEAAMESAGKAVRLNPKSPWGWFWLAEACNQAGLYAPEVVARKNELSFFRTDSEDDVRYRMHIYHKLGLAYRNLHQPETAIRHFRSEVDEATKLPAHEDRCTGAFMNIIATAAQDLDDLTRAQAMLEWARAIVPSFPSHPLDRSDLLQMGLQLPPADATRERP